MPKITVHVNSPVPFSDLAIGSLFRFPRGAANVIMKTNSGFVWLTGNYEGIVDSMIYPDEPVIPLYVDGEWKTTETKP